ncbi:MAG: PTS sugar transporter subunit IIA [Bacillota bacterium]|nr:PTS sugar transporter subunit IIA [Bacillota bacterium]
MFFDKKISFFQLEANDRNEALKELAAKLYSSNLVTEAFYNGILEREEKFPTGLSVVPYGIAIPHTEADKVITAQIAFASLNKPVKFYMMGKENEEVDVSLIFMLALKKAEDQITMLQKLVEIFQDVSLIREFANCKNQKELEGILLKVGLE